MRQFSEKEREKALAKISWYREQKKAGLKINIGGLKIVAIDGREPPSRSSAYRWEKTPCSKNYGRGSRLFSKEEKEKIITDIICNKSPSLSKALWDIETLTEAVNSKLSKKVSTDTIRKLLAEWGIKKEKKAKEDYNEENKFYICYKKYLYKRLCRKEVNLISPDYVSELIDITCYNKVLLLFVLFHPKGKFEFYVTDVSLDRRDNVFKPILKYLANLVKNKNLFFKINTGGFYSLKDFHHLYGFFDQNTEFIFLESRVIAKNEY